MLLSILQQMWQHSYLLCNVLEHCCKWRLFWHVHPKIRNTTSVLAKTENSKGHTDNAHSVRQFRVRCKRHFERDFRSPVCMRTHNQQRKRNGQVDRRESLRVRRTFFFWIVKCLETGTGIEHNRQRNRYIPNPLLRL